MSAASLPVVSKEFLVSSAIQSATQIGPQAVDECISYLFSTVFSSIPAFVDYWRYNSELEIPGNQPLAIRDISVLTNAFDLENLHINDIFALFCELVAPLGKNLWIKGEDTFKFSAKFSTDMQGKCLSLKLEHSCKLVERTDKVELNLSRLFTIMDICNIKGVEFSPNQSVYIKDLTKEEYALILREKTVESWLSTLKSRGAPGAAWTVKIPEVDNPFTLGSQKIQNGITLYLINFQHGLKIFLRETYQYNSIDSFLSRLEKFGRIHFPKFQPVQILLGNEKSFKPLDRAVNGLYYALEAKSIKVDIRKDRVLLISSKDQDFTAAELQKAIEFPSSESVSTALHTIAKIGSQQVDICISYLFSTVFSSIPAFVDYWRFNDELYVPANQALEIRNISVLTQNSIDRDGAMRVGARIYEDDTLQVRALKQRLSAYSTLFDALFASLGHSPRFEFGGDNFSSIAEISPFPAENCVIKATRHWRLESRTNEARFRVGDLLKTMQLCKIPSVEFDASQKVIIAGLREEEFKKLQATSGDISKIFKLREIKRSRWSLSLPKISRVDLIERDDANGKIAYCVDIYGGLKFTLEV